MIVTPEQDTRESILATHRRGEVRFRMQLYVADSGLLLAIGGFSFVRMQPARTKG
jgi:hypothetical protein